MYVIFPSESVYGPPFSNFKVSLWSTPWSAGGPPPVWHYKNSGLGAILASPPRLEFE